MASDSPALGAVSQSGTPTADGNKKVIILLPGIMGTELMSEPANPECASSGDGHFEGRVWLPNDVFSHLFLNSDGVSSFHPCDNILPTRPLTLPLVGWPYKWFQATVEGKGYEFSAYPGFDWRLDMEGQIELLDEWIDTYRADEENANKELYLVCHSMGGLLGRAFVADETRANKIKHVITVGTPHLGSPRAAHRLITGTCGFDFIDWFIADDTIRRILKYSPGAMQLLPTERSFRHITGYVKPHMANSPISTYVDTLGFLVDDQHTVQPILDFASNFHNTYGGFGSHFYGQKKYSILYGCNFNMPTVYAVKYNPQKRKKTLDDSKWESSDGTVPFWSGAVVKQENDAPQKNEVKVYKYAGKKTKSHMKLLTDAKIVEDIFLVLNDNTPLNGVLKDNDTGAAVSSSPSRSVQVFGSSHVLLVNEKNNMVSGVDQQYKVRSELDEVVFEIYDDKASFQLPPEGEYRIEVLSSHGTSVQIMIDATADALIVDELAASNAPLSNMLTSHLSRRGTEAEAPVTSRRTFEYPDGATISPIRHPVVQDALTLIESASIIEPQIERTESGRRVAAQFVGDIATQAGYRAAPLASLVLVGQRNQVNGFTSDVTAKVVLDQTINGAGGRAYMLSYASVDEGRSWNPVMPGDTLSIPKDSARFILFYSVNTAGFAEYPVQEIPLNWQ